MSVQASTYARQRLKENPPAFRKHGNRFVFLALSTYANRGGALAWPSASELGDVTGYNRTSVLRILAELVAAGELMQRGRNGRASVYGFPIAAVLEETKRPESGYVTSVCQSSCPACHGDGWVYPDDGRSGVVPCPLRRSA